MKGCPYDNAVAKATYKAIKTQFVNHRIFETDEQLKYEFADYVNGSPGSEHGEPFSVAREWKSLRNGNVNFQTGVKY